VSVLAMIWLYAETRDVQQVAALSRSIVWLVIPSLSLFILLPVLSNRGIGFFLSMTISIFSTVVAYFAMIYCLKYFSVRI
jgi:hypothetical protein